MSGSTDVLRKPSRVLAISMENIVPRPA
jgi:hypothetical protein